MEPDEYFWDFPVLAMRKCEIETQQKALEPLGQLLHLLQEGIHAVLKRSPMGVAALGARAATLRLLLGPGGVVVVVAVVGCF